MLKKATSILVIMFLFFTFINFTNAEQEYSEENPVWPSSIDKPINLSVRNDDGIFRIRWKNPDSVLKLYDDIQGHGHSLMLFIDWKLNDGEWNITLNSNDPDYDSEKHDYFIEDIGSLLADDDNTQEKFFVTWHFVPNSFEPFDLENDTYSFRARYVLLNYDEEIPPVYSPYSELTSIGKNAVGSTITKLDPPQNLTVKVEKHINGKPYFLLNWTVPESVKEANKHFPVYHRLDFKVGDGKWLSETAGDSLDVAASKLLADSVEFDPVEKDIVDEIVIEENIYHFRILFECEPSQDKHIRSVFSNIASTKIEGYKSASAWAVGELDKADAYNLIPDSIRNNMQAPITREEFAEVALLLYEKTMGVTVPPVTEDNFTDTDNSQVLKAFKLGIVKGVNAEMTLFAPAQRINRQECATMLGRTLEIMIPEADFSIEGAPVFSDEKDIDSWAYKYVKYMSKIGVIKGTDGKFMPKAVTDREKAEGYATATREQAVIMSARIYETYKD